MNNIITQEEKDNIDDICKMYKITNYNINGDGSVDINGNVHLYNIKASRRIPITFNNVSGNFICSNNKIASLIGCPKVVGGDFHCGGSKYLTSLIGCPSEVGGDFNCVFSRLSSLEHCPTSVGGGFNCSNNQISSLEHCPTSVGGDFECRQNQLTSLVYCPKVVGGELDCRYNLITSLEHCPNEVDGGFNCMYNELPFIFELHMERLSSEERNVFMKYQHYYDVWTPDFNEENMNYLIAEINDGLR
jgi:hypothetical protein